MSTSYNFQICYIVLNQYVQVYFGIGFILIKPFSTSECYWLFEETDSNVSNPMKKVVTLKALKNKGRMSVETAFEVLSPKVHQVIPTQNIVTTIISEIYTFWHQNRPGAISCPVYVVVHVATGTALSSRYFPNCRRHQPWLQ